MQLPGAGRAKGVRVEEPEHRHGGSKATPARSCRETAARGGSPRKRRWPPSGRKQLGRLIRRPPARPGLVAADQTLRAQAGQCLPDRGRAVHALERGDDRVRRHHRRHVRIVLPPLERLGMYRRQCLQHREFARRQTGRSRGRAVHRLKLALILLLDPAAGRHACGKHRSLSSIVVTARIWTSPGRGRVIRFAATGITVSPDGHFDFASSSTKGAVMDPEQTTPVRVIDPAHVEVQCPCGGRPVTEVNMLSLSEQHAVGCADCGRSYLVRSSLAGISAILTDCRRTFC